MTGSIRKTAGIIGLGANVVKSYLLEVDVLRSSVGLTPTSAVFDKGVRDSLSHCGHNGIRVGNSALDIWVARRGSITPFTPEDVEGVNIDIACGVTRVYDFILRGKVSIQSK